MVDVPDGPSLAGDDELVALPRRSHRKPGDGATGEADAAEDASNPRRAKSIRKPAGSTQQAEVDTAMVDVPDGPSLAGDDELVALPRRSHRKPGDGATGDAASVAEDDPAAAKRTRSVKRATGAAQQAELDVAIVSQSFAFDAEASDEGLVAMPRRSHKNSGLGHQSDSSATVIDDDAPGIDGDDGLTQLSRPRRGKPTTTAEVPNTNGSGDGIQRARKGRSHSIVAEAELIGGSDASAIDDFEASMLVPASGRPTRHGSDAHSPDDGGLASNRRRSGRSHSIADSAQVLDDTEANVVDDFEASRLDPTSHHTRKESVDSNFGEVQKSTRTSRAVSLVETGESGSFGSPVNSSPAMNRARSKNRRSSAVPEADAQLVDDDEAGVVPDMEASHLAQVPLPGHHHGDGANASPPAEKLTSGQSANPRRSIVEPFLPTSEALSEGEMSPLAGRKQRSNLEGSPRLATKRQSVFADNEELLRRLSDAQFKSESQQLIKRFLARIQRTKKIILNQADLDTLRSHFVHCDIDGSGGIDKKEFVLFASEAMDLTNMTQRDIDALFDELDVNKTGTLTMEEFVDMYKELALREAIRRDPSLDGKIVKGTTVAQMLEEGNALEQAAKLHKIKSTVVADPIQAAFLNDAVRIVGDAILEDPATSQVLSADPEFVKTTSDCAQLAQYLNTHPSAIGRARLDQLEVSLKGKARVVHRLSRARNHGHGEQLEVDAAIAPESPAGAIKEFPTLSNRRTSQHHILGSDGGSDPSSPSSQNFGSPVSSQQVNSASSPLSENSPVFPQRRRRSVLSGHTQEIATAVVADAEGQGFEEEFQSLRAERMSNRRHRLLWDVEDRPAWSLPAIDEVKNDTTVKAFLNDGVGNADVVRESIVELSKRKEQENEDLFERFPFLTPLPNGVPLSELGLDTNARIAALASRKKSQREKYEAEVKEVVAALAAQRVKELEALVDEESDVAARLRDVAVSDRTRRRMSRRQSKMVVQQRSEHSSSSDDDREAAGAIRRAQEDRDAELIRRRQEIAQAKEDEARRKAEHEEALRRQRENDANELKKKNQQLRQVAANKAEAENLIKRSVIRSIKASSADVDLDVNDLELIRNHFDFYDQEQSGVMTKPQFLEFYQGTLDGFSSLAKKEIDDLFKRFAVDDPNEINFMEFVEVYKHVATGELFKKDPKLAQKKKSNVGPQRMQSVKSMAPKKPSELQSKPSVRR